MTQHKDRIQNAAQIVKRDGKAAWCGTRPQHQVSLFNPEQSIIVLTQSSESARSGLVAVWLVDGPNSATFHLEGGGTATADVKNNTLVYIGTKRIVSIDFVGATTDYKCLRPSVPNVDENGKPTTPSTNATVDYATDLQCGTTNK